MLDDPASAAAALIYLAQTAPVVALRLDAAHRVVDANAQGRALLGDAAVGRGFAESLVEFVDTCDLATELARSGEVCRLTVSTVSGLPETLYFRFFPLPDGALALGSLDLGEQERLRREMLSLNREANDLTRQLHQANAELRELNELKNRFLGMAAHDLRKPIGVVMTYSEFVLDEAGGRLSEEHRGFLRTCVAAATGMKRLIDNFLDVSVIESGQLRLELVPASAPEIVAGAEPIARLVAGRKKVDLLVAPGDEARRLRVDAPKVQQVLLNLVGNAVEHSLPGQRVWLSSSWDGETLVFAVRDEGPGIAPEDQARLFTAFARAGTRKTAGERSVGLGLAIARLIVEAHGGRIWVDSTPGHGATFRFALPVRPQSPGGAAS